MTDIITLFTQWCGPTAAGWTGAGMFLGGLIASPLHCGPMCGGFVLGQVSDGLARLPAARLTECQRLRAAALPSYHLGRLTTYTGLGFGAGTGGFALQSLGVNAGVPLLFGALLLMLQAGQRWRPGLRLPVARSARGYPLGLVLGFLPCGLLYAALAAAAATGSPWAGALAMALFGLGTIPALVAVGLFGAAGGRRFRGLLTAATPGVLLFNAGLLALLGIRTLAGG